MSDSLHYQIVIVGGGTAGITVAAQLTRGWFNSRDVAVIEPSDKHYYRPLWTLVGAGLAKKEATEHTEASVIPRGVTWIRDAVAEFLPEQNTIRTRDGKTITYDWLIVGAGLQINWDKIPGLKASLWRNGVCSKPTVTRTFPFRKGRSIVDIQHKILLVIFGIFIAFGGMLWVGQAEDQKSSDAHRPIPEGPLGDAIRLGQDLVENTTSHRLSKPFVGNALNCTSCHLKNGTDSKAASFIRVATAYPAWSPREKSVITLEDRILNCFMRSCDGIRPPLGSEVSVSIAAYITWLSTDQPIHMNSERPAGPHAVPQLKVNVSQANRQRGKKLYSARCVACHAENGQGDKENPPVWGARSFNEGAGLANVAQLASWLKVAMPLDEADLTPQESLDLATFINSHERPKFRLSEHLPPNEHLGTFNSNLRIEDANLAK